MVEPPVLRSGTKHRILTADLIDKSGDTAITRARVQVIRESKVKRKVTRAARFSSEPWVQSDLSTIAQDRALRSPKDPVADRVVDPIPQY